MATETKYHMPTILIVTLLVEALFWGGAAITWFFLLDDIPGFRWGFQAALWGLLVIPFMVAGFLTLTAWKNRSIERFADERLLRFLSPELSTGRALVKFLLFRFAYAFLVIALANPQIGTKLEEGKTEGIDLIVALDLSNSMKAEDIRPSRLEKAKRAINRLVEKLHGDRLGVVVFAGEAYVQLPVTSDHSAAKLFLSNLDPSSVPVQGTAIGEAIDLAVRSFNMENGAKKAVIVISDGENHQGDAIAAAERAAKKNITVHTVGMGSPDGAPIPIYKGERQVGYKKGPNGETVVSKLNQSMLKRIASAGQGSNVQADNQGVGLNMLMKKIEEMEKKEFDTKVYTEHKDRFPLFLGTGLALLFIELLIPTRKSRWSQRVDLFRKRKD